MNQVDPIKKLDSLLNYVYSKQFQDSCTDGLFEINQVKNVTLHGWSWDDKPAPFSVFDSEHELQEAASLLSDQGKLIYCDGKYSTTFKGRVFVQEGGYKGKEKRKRRKAFIHRWEIWLIIIFTGVIMIAEIVSAASSVHASFLSQ